MSDSVSAQVAWSAIEVFAFDRGLRNYVDDTTARQFRVVKQPGSRRVVVDAPRAAFEKLANAMLSLSQDRGVTLKGQRAAAVIWRRMNKALNGSDTPKKQEARDGV